MKHFIRNDKTNSLDKLFFNIVRFIECYKITANDVLYEEFFFHRKYLAT